MLRIAIIGSGNVATHLALGFAHAGCQVIEVCSATPAHARRLAELLGPDCRAVSDPAKLSTDADLYLISVSDKAVAQVAAQMPHVSGLVAHTSGSIPLTALAPCSDRTAVIYPLQTFTRDADIDLTKVPFFTEASSAEALAIADEIAHLLSSHVYHADSAHRQTLHIAGVLSCNFVNYLWSQTADLLAADGYDFSVVEPLIRVTLDKAVAIGPHAAQTGPAARGDIQVIERHIDRLAAEHPDLADIYRTLSVAIIAEKNK